MKDKSMTVKSRLLELLEQHKGETYLARILAGSFPVHEPQFGKL